MSEAVVISSWLNSSWRSPSRRASSQSGRSAGRVASEVMRNAMIRNSASVMDAPLGKWTEVSRRHSAWCAYTLSYPLHSFH